ncbi:MAG: SRPBCC family protein [Woeseiaceae bacterium]|nr:SRPBCC family protein [Woeseiaceae bacterium]
MNDYGELLDEQTVRFVRVLPGPIERVWSYLTESDKRAQWLCGGDVETSVDGHVDMHFHNLSLSEASDGDIPRPEKYRDRPPKMSFAGKVTRCEPPHVLHHTWEFDDEDSEVCYELSEEGDQVRLVLTHRRLDSKDTVLSVSGGWHTHLNVLVDVLNGATPRPFYRMQTKFEAEYSERLGKN